MAKYTVLFLVLLILFSGCDSQVPVSEPPVPGNEPTAPSDAGTIEDLQALRDTTLFESDTGFNISLDVHFGHTADVELHYGVQSEGTAVSVNQGGERGQLLYLHPQHLGASSVDVKVNDAAGNFKIHTFQVDVVSDCPSEPTDAEGEIFPLTTGTTRNFDYLWTDRTQWHSVRIDGELTWEVLSIECNRGREIYRIAERLVADVHSSDASTDTTYQISESRSITFAKDDNLLYLAPYFAEGVPRLSSDSVQDTLRVDSPDPHSIFGNPGWRAHIVLVRGKGLVSRSFFHHRGVGADQEETITSAH